MKIAVFETKTEADRYKEFAEGMTWKQNELGGWYIETYASTRGGSCRYGQAYKPDVSLQEAKQRFVNFYWPLNQRDNEEE
jgi:hypothetical protein